MLVDEGAAESDESTDELAWDEFAAEFDRRDATFRYGHRDDSAGAETGETARGGDEPEPTDTEERRLAEAGDAFEADESVRTEVTERRTVERELVETATVETEVVDGERTSAEVVDTEVIDRELTDCTIDESGEYIEADLRERKRFTTEVRRRDRIEARVVDADVDEARTVDVDTVDREVDAREGSASVDEDAVEREADGTEDRERAVTDAEAEVVDGETDRDEWTERRLVETEVVSRYRVRADVTRRDRIEREVIGEEITDTEFVDEGTAVRGASERDEAADHDPTNETVWVDDSHEGDAVVDGDGETVGRITAVDGLTIRVDVNPGAAERLAGGPGAEESADGTATVRQNQVEEIREDSAVVVDLERDRSGGG